MAHGKLEVVGQVNDTIQAVSVMLPPFWSLQSETWFKQIEAQFQLNSSDYFRPE